MAPYGHDQRRCGGRWKGPPRRDRARNGHPGQQWSRHSYPQDARRSEPSHGSFGRQQHHPPGRWGHSSGGHQGQEQRPSFPRCMTESPPRGQWRHASGPPGQRGRLPPADNRFRRSSHPPDFAATNGREGHKRSRSLSSDRRNDTRGLGRQRESCGSNYRTTDGDEGHKRSRHDRDNDQSQGQSRLQQPSQKSKYHKNDDGAVASSRSQQMPQSRHQQPTHSDRAAKTSPPRHVPIGNARTAQGQSQDCKPLRITATENREKSYKPSQNHSASVDPPIKYPMATLGAVQHLFSQDKQQQQQAKWQDQAPLIEHSPKAIAVDKQGKSLDLKDPKATAKTNDRSNSNSNSNSNINATPIKNPMSTLGAVQHLFSHGKQSHDLKDPKATAKSNDRSHSKSTGGSEIGKPQKVARAAAAENDVAIADNEKKTAAKQQSGAMKAYLDGYGTDSDEEEEDKSNDEQQQQPISQRSQPRVQHQKSDLKKRPHQASNSNDRVAFRQNKRLDTKQVLGRSVLASLENKVARRQSKPKELPKQTPSSTVAISIRDTKMQAGETEHKDNQASKQNSHDRDQHDKATGSVAETVFDAGTNISAEAHTGKIKLAGKPKDPPKVDEKDFIIKASAKESKDLGTSDAVLATTTAAPVTTEVTLNGSAEAAVAKPREMTTDGASTKGLSAGELLFSGFYATKESGVDGKRTKATETGTKQATKKTKKKKKKKKQTVADRVLRCNPALRTNVAIGTHLVFAVDSSKVMKQGTSGVSAGNSLSKWKVVLDGIKGLLPEQLTGNGDLVISLVTFHMDKAQTILERIPLTKDFKSSTIWKELDSLSGCKPSGNTGFSTGLEAARVVGSNKERGPSNQRVVLVFMAAGRPLDLQSQLSSHLLAKGQKKQKVSPGQSIAAMQLEHGARFKLHLVSLNVQAKPWLENLSNRYKGTLHDPMEPLVRKDGSFVEPDIEPVFRSISLSVTAIRGTQYHTATATRDGQASDSAPEGGKVIMTAHLADPASGITAPRRQVILPRMEVTTDATTSAVSTLPFEPIDPVTGQPRDTGKRKHTNLPAWMTRKQSVPEKDQCKPLAEDSKVPAVSEKDNSTSSSSQVPAVLGAVVADPNQNSSPPAIPEGPQFPAVLGAIVAEHNQNSSPPSPPGIPEGPQVPAVLGAVVAEPKQTEIQPMTVNEDENLQVRATGHRMHLNSPAWMTRPKEQEAEAEKAAVESNATIE
ncbi:expressed unknown protein [Seminavis robusta]|uniref:VWFA domain-containing protein n=1 Tax=Seminavis robusta TaxID=568900 RepID=A0A9N8EJ17_9STRA|nr:expressed unknown protein [Seminavis robusta]|eukprot:Sro1159_g247530.1 n/a (1216) ;mRNA; f:2174-5922